ncbi:bifunctional diguanylate cyclase/phosphodiesterase [Nakamurella sp. PAMC28650]|uniref:putative bifunctional diguanylate cyclase/phosphodiesterase n=1 Tax=Nakamurella sp. PAMC28650 TaxID=2762325 RepID=UPI00164D83FF|nr:EAL domain-containing protein [Nakamurella sp. PAMC28650]QNK79349.1 EAL domain-containing protein [Nakamurella sp. PAMC28650]
MPNDDFASAAVKEMNLPLTKVLIEFADILGTDFSIPIILDHLVKRIVDILPVTGVGVMLMGEGQELHFVAASDHKVMSIETLQNELIEGPCLAAYRTGERVSVPDLSSDQQFANFSPRALEAGLAAVFTFPLRLGGRRLGALDLYRDTPGELNDDDLQIAQILADVASGYLMNALTRQDASAKAAQLRHQNLHDPLTGLPNRTLFAELLDHAVERARSSQQVAAVLFVDLDGFKFVNDTHGHHVGDELLMAVATRVSGLLRPEDTLSRQGGDEFVALCENLATAADAEVTAQRITAALAEPFDLPSTQVVVSASVGIAFSGPGQDLPATLLRDADFAMYQAKNSGGGRHHVSDPTARLAAEHRTELDRDLRTAERLGQLFLAYQPIISLRTGLLTGVEALLRWQHPQRGLVMPDVTIPSAERTGLISPIGQWVLRQACDDLVRWRREGTAVGQVAVNVSAQQVMGSSFVKTVASVLSETGADPGRLCLEVTESLFLSDTERAARVLHEVKDLGVRLSLDDFGTGYSSLSYLQHFPVDIVKIDRSFTAKMTKDKATKSIVRAVIELSHVMDKSVVAEGVETTADLQEITELGADYAQGFYFSRPVSRDKISTYVQRQA